MNPALLSSTKMDFQTPPDFLDLVRRVGRITLDPCTGPTNPTRADYPCTEETDGLSHSWSYVLAKHGGLFFTNPPFGRALPTWINKAVREGELGAEGVILVPSRTDTAWWQKLAENVDAGLFWRGRLTFWDQATNAPALTWSKKRQRFEVMPAPFPVFVGYFGPNKDRFFQAFAGKGRFL